MIEHTTYLIVGASHAGLEALQAIRTVDGAGAAMLVGREAGLPYSPVVLPYLVSGEADPQHASLCDDEYFMRSGVSVSRGVTLHRIDVENSVAIMDSGLQVHYEKLLLATGAASVIPRVDGLSRVRFHVLRTLQDAVLLRSAASQARQAVVLGAGAIGMHVAESLQRAGLSTTLVESHARVLPDYFDTEAAGLIQAAFVRSGVNILTGRRAVSVFGRDDGCEVTLEDGERLPAELLMVSEGVCPAMDYLSGTAIAHDRGILVDDSMRTNVANIWAAGDVAQARSFFTGQAVLNTTLSDAVRQGRVAGLAMAGDKEKVRYDGGVPFSMHHFFGSQAVSVGSADETDCEVLRMVDRRMGRYLKMVIRDNHLEGVFAIDVPIEGSSMWELILRRVDLSPIKEQLLDSCRMLMSRPAVN